MIELRQEGLETPAISLPGMPTAGQIKAPVRGGEGLCYANARLFPAYPFC